MKQFKRTSAALWAAVFILSVILPPGETVLASTWDGAETAAERAEKIDGYAGRAGGYTDQTKDAENVKEPVSGEGGEMAEELRAVEDPEPEKDWEIQDNTGQTTQEPAQKPEQEPESEEARTEMRDGAVEGEGAEDLELLAVEQDASDEEAPAARLDLSQGAVTITAMGYTHGGSEIPFTGAYQLWQSELTTANPIRVENGSHHIQLENIHVDASERSAAFTIGSGAGVILELVGDNSFSSNTNYAGIHLYVERSQNRQAELTIKGNGRLSAWGGANAAGIGGGFEASNGQVTLESGAVFAYGGAGGAGIGGGNNSSSYKVNDCDGGIITITGGSVTAYGGDSAAGIGGGNHGDGGAITITGGTVELAQGGGGGAGIGSGLGSHVKSDKGPGYYTGGQITLTGNFLIREALGGGNAAGIGGGMYADSGRVEILGGHIELAQGGAGTAESYHHGAAGIGAGYQGHCDVFIKGAHIEQAVGSFSGPGIGSGATANLAQRENDSVAKASNVFICSSYIDLARGGEYGGAGIGGGVSCDHVTVTLCGHRIVAEGGPGGAGVGSGLYAETYKYACKTEAVVHIKCGELAAVGENGGEDIGHGRDNDKGEVLINTDEADLEGTPSVPKIDSDGYEGYYTGLAYGITVDIPDAAVTYAETAEGPYEEAKPMYREVGEYLTFYQAEKDHFTFYGSEEVIIKPLDGGDGTGGKNRNRNNSDRNVTEPEEAASSLEEGETDVNELSDTNQQKPEGSGGQAAEGPEELSWEDRNSEDQPDDSGRPATSGKINPKTGLSFSGRHVFLLFVVISAAIWSAFLRSRH